MAAPIAASLTLPDDSGNAGKKFRTETRVVGGNTVHENFIVPTPAITILGKYFFSSSQLSIGTSAQNGTSTAFFWFQLPIAATTVVAQIKYVSLDCNANAATAAPTAPFLSVTKMTFTGTASGATAAALPAQTAMPANQMICRTAVTGMTPTLLVDFAGFSVPAILTAVGSYGGAEVCLPYDPTSFTRGLDLEIGAGEGVVVWQSQAGTVSDPRRFNFQMEWLEIDLS